MRTQNPQNAAQISVAQPTQQRLLRLNVTQLKNLRDVEIDFGGQNLTAIMGANCCGKTTVLHALACAFRPLNDGGSNFKFSHFFKPNTDLLWAGSDFTVHFKDRLGPVERNDLHQRYTKAGDRWHPRYGKRPGRNVRFMSIKESVPDLEVLTLKSMIHYTREPASDELSVLIRDTAGQVLNKAYTDFHRVTYKYGHRRSVGVTTNGMTYAGVSMSTGEQRVFRILETVFGAPDYSLILVDEIDLFLHQDALVRLINKLHEHCAAKKKQLVFSTHFPPIAKLHDKVSVLTLHRTTAKTVLWRGYSHEALRHITGLQERPLNIYVEDDAAEAIVSHVASDLGIRKFVQFGHFGPASNAYTIGAGLLLSDANLENTLIILDGDTYAKKPERITNIKRVLTGDQPIHDKQRATLLRIIRALIPPDALCPEQMLNQMLHTLGPNGISAGEAALLRIAHEVVNVTERHRFVNEIIEQTGESREVALSKLVALASLAPGWGRYTKIVRLWLIKRARALNLPLVTS